MPTSHYTTVNSVRLHYLEAGEGDPILLLHGFPTSSHLYRNILPNLGKTHRARPPKLRPRRQTGRRRVRLRLLRCLRHKQAEHPSRRRPSERGVQDRSRQGMRSKGSRTETRVHATSLQSGSLRSNAPGSGVRSSARFGFSVSAIPVAKCLQPSKRGTGFASELSKQVKRTRPRLCRGELGV